MHATPRTCVQLRSGRGSSRFGVRVSGWGSRVSSGLGGQGLAILGSGSSGVGRVWSQGQGPGSGSEGSGKMSSGQEVQSRCGSFRVKGNWIPGPANKPQDLSCRMSNVCGVADDRLSPNFAQQYH